jgi:hypothetical protein
MPKPVVNIMLSPISGMYFVCCDIHGDTPYWTQAEAEEALAEHREQHRAEGLPC